MDSESFSHIPTKKEYEDSLLAYAKLINDAKKGDDYQEVSLFDDDFFQ
jgi:hypothetical protein